MSFGSSSRPPRRTLKWQGGTWFVVLLVLLWLVYARREAVEPAPADAPATANASQQTHLPAQRGELHRVLRAVDGDTLLLADHTRIRLIGVNAPETVKPDTPVQPFGPEASRFTHQFCDGREVRLEYDQERTDQYGRTLAYVYDGNRLLNEELLRNGLAHWERHYHYSNAMKDRFRAAEAEARAARRGLWSLESR